MISKVTIETWNGGTVHLELSSPQPEAFEFEHKSLVPGHTLRVPHNPESIIVHHHSHHDPYVDFWWGAPSMFPKRMSA